MEKNECPTNCPFLGFRSFLPETLPFYCEKYNLYLGMNPAKKVVKCALCQGISAHCQQQGLELLETCVGSVTELKKAFLGMRPSDQQKLVDILAQSGIKCAQIYGIHAVGGVVEVFYLRVYGVVSGCNVG